MCGRARCTLRPDDFSRACHLNSRQVRHVDMDRYRASYNVAPGFNLPVVRRDDGGGNSDDVVLHCMKWGLVPSFTKKSEKPDHFKMFNARSESIREKASFRRLIPKNRCLVAVEGFYEWKKNGSRKQPYYIYFKDGRPLVFAALYDSWKNSEGEVMYTFTILTTSSSSALEWLHDRMPVIFGNKDTTSMWLNDSSPDLDKILKPYKESDLAWYPVTPAIGKLSFDGPECIKEIQLKSDEVKPISEFFSKKGASSQQDSKFQSNVSQQDSKPQSNVTEENPPKTDELNGVEEESETGKSVDHQAVTSKDDHHIKPDVSSLSQGRAISVKKEEPVTEDQLKSVKEEPEMCKEVSSSPSREEVIHTPLKRDHEETSADMRPSTKRTSKPHKSPAAKKSKGASDTQSTLFSYFGKS